MKKMQVLMLMALMVLGAAELSAQVRGRESMSPRKGSIAQYDKKDKPSNGSAVRGGDLRGFHKPGGPQVGRPGQKPGKPGGPHAAWGYGHHHLHQVAPCPHHLKYHKGCCCDKKLCRKYHKHYYKHHKRCPRCGHRYAC